MLTVLLKENSKSLADEVLFNFIPIALKLVEFSRDIILKEGVDIEEKHIFCSASSSRRTIFRFLPEINPKFLSTLIKAEFLIEMLFSEFTVKKT